MMKVQKKLERTRKIVVEVEADGTKFRAIVADHYDSDDPATVFAGDNVSLMTGDKGPAVMFPIKSWLAIREAVDRAISEFKAAYPKSPQ
jgi:hypothetical protein